MEGVVSRVVDLIEPFRDFSYYSPLQKGSCSIKAVLPALTGKDYSALEISGGSEASLAFLSSGNDAKVRANLEKYCGLDTEGMVWIVESLKNIILQ